ncbi:MAG: glycosyltransferase [Wenzhouxiangellaceae bacterium]|nr:glycosyltransferase [Wenzhouxiangellaceae bacterium]
MTDSAAVPRVRVAFVSDSMPERNGVGAYYTDLIEQLDEVSDSGGFESIFLCPGREAGGRLHFPLPGDTTQKVFLPSPRRFGGVMRRLEPDVVVVATPGPYGMLGVRWARKLGARLIVGFHTDYAGVTDLYGASLLKWLSRGYFRRIDRLMFRKADHVLVNTAPMIEQARRIGAREVSRIGTLVPRVFLTTPLVPPRETFGRVLFAGRLAPEKRLDRLIGAAERRPELQFAIAGDGPLKNDVRTAAGRLPNLEYLGWLGRETLLGEIDASDALVLPSEFESFGNVALEAMARCRIALVTRTCGIADWTRLARHMVVFDLDEPLDEVLAGTANRPARERIALAQGACEVARELNRTSLRQWVELLAPGAGFEAAD